MATRSLQARVWRHSCALAGSFAASYTTYLWGNRAVTHHAHLTEPVSLFDPPPRKQLPGWVAEIYSVQVHCWNV